MTAVSPLKTDHILEIGPGLAVLTKPLLEQSGKLDCIEIDRDLITRLEDNFKDNPKFTIHNADALKFDLNTLNVKSKSLRVVGNLPYNITTPLLFHLLNYCDLIRDMHFMLQLEVVERITACPNTKAFGKLTLMIQYLCKAQFLFPVDPQSFSPPPKVNSAFIRLTPYENPPHKVDDFKLFETLTAAAFNQRRKMISNSLKSYLELNDFAALNLDPNLRPEQLSLERWVALCNYVSKNSKRSSERLKG
jgi:16S rRNA (adenine1518-N6/adenine1519-N6)-dimethyltransferase